MLSFYKITVSRMQTELRLLTLSKKKRQKSMYIKYWLYCIAFGVTPLHYKTFKCWSTKHTQTHTRAYSYKVMHFCDAGARFTDILKLTYCKSTLTIT